MAAVRSMVAKDLRRRLRSPFGLVAVLAFPVLFAGMLAVTFGSHGDRVPRLRLLVENRDGEFLGNALVTMLGSKEAAERMEVTLVSAGEGAARIGRGEASALLVVPAGFTRDVLDARPTRLELLRNPAEGIMPEVAEQLGGVLVEGLDAAVRALRPSLRRIRELSRHGAVRIDDAAVVGIALDVKHAVDGAEKFVFPPVIALESSGDGSGEAGGTGTATIFLLVLPGVSVYALFLIGDLGMRDLVTEGDLGTLRRQLAGPVRSWEIVVAKAVYAAMLSVVGLAVLTAVGAVVLRRPVDPAGYLLLSAALVLAVTGAGATVYALARTERRGATVAAVAYLVLAFAGGSFLPLEAMPRAVRAIAPVSPFYWGAQGFKKLVGDGGGAAAVLPNVAVLAGLGLGLLALGSALLARRMRSGAGA